ncbi:MAG: flagellar export protein FliJ [Treponema sp.]|jgi:flagellar FliJ protein|nr:flagellar export protein FliJ [Treponema sp.]
MKRFSFNLEKFLALRKFEEQEAKTELGRAIGALSEIEQRLRSLAEERSRAAASQFAPENSAAMIQQYMFYLLRLDSAREQLCKEAALAEMKVEEARELFRTAYQNREALDRLKAKREKEYKKEMLAEDTSLTDEIAGSRAARNR